MSFINLAASAVYVVAAIACFFATSAARRLGDSMSTRNWMVIGMLFLLLAPMRLFGIEHAISDYFRGIARHAGDYSARQELQRPLAAVMVIVSAIGASLGVGYAARLRSHRDRLIFLSQAATFAMIGLIMFRILSLHAVDALLYRGGWMRLNYLIDMGATATVLASALLYWEITKRPAGAQPSRRR